MKGFQPVAKAIATHIRSILRLCKTQRKQRQSNDCKSKRYKGRLHKVRPPKLQVDEKSLNLECSVPFYSTHRQNVIIGQPTEPGECLCACAEENWPSLSVEQKMRIYFAYWDRLTETNQRMVCRILGRKFFLNGREGAWKAKFPIRVLGKRLSLSRFSFWTAVEARCKKDARLMAFLSEPVCYCGVDEQVTFQPFTRV